MTATVWPLREIPADRLSQEAAFRRCQSLGWHVAWEPLPTQHTLTRFRQASALGELQCLVATAPWAAAQWPDLPGLAWDALDPASARKLFDAPVQGPIAVDWLEPGRTQWLQQVPASDAAPLPSSLPCLHTEHGPVWVEQLRVDAAVPGIAMALPELLPVPVLYRLGQLPLNLGQLRGLRVGDVVLIAQLHPLGLTHGRPLFSFAFNEGHMIINEFESAFAGEPAAAPYEMAPVAPALDVAALPMTVDIILCQLTHTVAELGQLQPGSTVLMAQDAHRQVELRVHGQRVATGELVRVGDGLGVQLSECASAT